MISGFMSAVTAAPQCIAPPATATPTHDVKADARRRPPTITLPSLHTCALCRGMRSCPFVAKVPIQVGPRFVKRKHSYDSFHGTSRIHESFSCKSVETYRHSKMRGSIALDCVITCGIGAHREFQLSLQSATMYRVIQIIYEIPVPFSPITFTTAAIRRASSSEVIVKAGVR